MHINARKVATVAAAGAVGLSLFGAGVGASFTDSAAAGQHVSTGTVNLLVSTDGQNWAKSVTFAPDGPINSQGETANKLIYVENTGNLAMSINSIDIVKSGNLPVTVASYFSLGLPNGGMPFPLAPNGHAFAMLTYTVPADSPQGASTDITVTVNGTDLTS